MIIIEYLKYKKEQNMPYFIAIQNLILFFIVVGIPFIIGITIGQIVEEYMITTSVPYAITYIFVVILSLIIGFGILFGIRYFVLDYSKFIENQQNT